MNQTTAERLAEPLDAKRIKQRAAGGNRPALSYLETHDVIRTANEIFGFGGWGHEVVDLRGIPPVTVHSGDGKPGISVGYVCVVRLQVRGCEPTSGVGFGDATEYRESAGVTAHELAAKEAESDALKRALKNFGDQFGLALYSKDAATSGHVTNSPAAAAGGRTAGDSTSTEPGAAPPDGDGTMFFPPDPAQGFDVPQGDRTEAQAKLLHAVLPKLVKAGVLTDDGFIAMARDNGASGDGVNACIDTLGKVGASALISRLKDIEKQQVAA